MTNQANFQSIPAAQDSSIVSQEQCWFCLPRPVNMATQILGGKKASWIIKAACGHMLFDLKTQLITQSKVNYRRESYQYPCWQYSLWHVILQRLRNIDLKFGGSQLLTQILTQKFNEKVFMAGGQKFEKTIAIQFWFIRQYMEFVPLAYAGMKGLLTAWVVWLLHHVYQNLTFVKEKIKQVKIICSSVCIWATIELIWIKASYGGNCKIWLNMLLHGIFSNKWERIYYLGFPIRAKSYMFGN